MNPLRVLPNRRDFLAKSSGAAMCAACTRWTAGAAMAASGAAALIPEVKPKIRLVFTHPNPQRQGWPYQGYDYEGRKKMGSSPDRVGDFHLPIPSG